MPNTADSEHLNGLMRASLYDVQNFLQSHLLRILTIFYFGVDLI